MRGPTPPEFCFPAQIHCATARVPLARIGEIEDIDLAWAYLASDASGFVAGERRAWFEMRPRRSSP